MIARMQEDVEFIQKLSDYPTMDDGLDAEEIKKRFDAGSVAIKTFINDSLIPETEQEIAGVVERVNSSEESIKEHKETLEQLANSLKELAEAGRIQLFRLGYTTETDTYFLDGTSYAELKALHDDRKHIALQHDFLGVPECFHCSGMTTLNGVTGLAFHFCFKATSKWAFVGSDGSIQVGFMTNESGGKEETAPDIYQQLLTGYDRVNAQLMEMVAMRGAGGIAEIAIYEDDLTCFISSNGVNAKYQLSTKTITLTAGAVHYSAYCIPAEFAPLASVALSSNFPNIEITMERGYGENEGLARFVFRNTHDSITHNGICGGEGVYPLAQLSISELSDLRVGYDGATYPTAGEAVRAQVKAAMENGGGGGASAGKINLFRIKGGTASGFSLVDTTYAELKELYDNNKHIGLYFVFSKTGAKHYHCSGATSLNGLAGLAFQFCFGDKSEWVFVGEDDSVQLGTVSSSGVELDTTLTESGKAADAKAVGDKLGDIETALDSIIEIQNGLIGGGTE